jgi:hypothetical protein
MDLAAPAEQGLRENGSAAARSVVMAIVMAVALFSPPDTE